MQLAWKEGCAQELLRELRAIGAGSSENSEDNANFIHVLAEAVYGAVERLAKEPDVRLLSSLCCFLPVSTIAVFAGAAASAGRASDHNVVRAVATQ